MANSILDNLSTAQREATEYCGGAQLIIAGAGSGKTRVLTCKIAYLLQQGMRPWHILALTFTNKAANEMKERISRIVGLSCARQLNMGTFHSIFSRILRAEAAHIGYNPNFTIYDQSDSRSMIRAIIREMGLDEKIYVYTSIADRISMAKNHLLSPQDYAASQQAKNDALQKRQAIKDIYFRYASRLRQANVMDFDDLLLNTYTLFNTAEDVRLKYADRFHYVLVDEYQDTNHAQQAIVMQLTRERQMVCVVGDDAQSIYGFRGANIDNILNFQSAYPAARLFKLEQNYRSTKAIVLAANSLIRHNERQIDKNVFSDNEHGDKLVFTQAYSDREEAAIVCKNIMRIKHEENCPYSGFAILYRTNAQSRVIEEELRKQGVPYKIYGGLSFYQRKEIKDIISYFRLVVNNFDEEAFRRVINYPARGIGDVTMSKIRTAATEHGVSLWDVAADLGRYGVILSKGTAAKIASFCGMVSAWTEKALESDAYTIGAAIIKESGLSKEFFGSKTPEDMARQENVNEFLAGMQDFVASRREEGLEANVRLADFLQEVALLSDIDSDNENNDGEKVSLMTIHSAKGLEFPTVFIVGLEENIFPSPLSTGSARELEEERRLLYVAITRAEKHCLLSCAQYRFRYGRLEFDTPSRFIKDIDSAYITKHFAQGNARQRGFDTMSKAQKHDKPEWMTEERKDIAEHGTPLSRTGTTLRHTVAADRFSDKLPEYTPRLKPVSFSVNDARREETDLPAGINVGNVIEHQRFGIGTVTNVEGGGESAKITVRFENTGTKQLLLKFAKYKILK